MEFRVWGLGLGQYIVTTLTETSLLPGVSAPTACSEGGEGRVLAVGLVRSQFLGLEG